MKKITKALLIALAMIMVLSTVVSAGVPYTTFTYSAGKQVLISPAAYVPDRSVNGSYMQLPDGLSASASCIEEGPDGRIYIADSGNNRIVVLDQYYKFKMQISTFINEHGVPDSFANPQGVFVKDGVIFVCDTDKNRIVMFDLEGNYIKIIPQPKSNLFEEGDIYKPVACAVDDYGRIFVVSSTTYQGVIVLNTEGAFFGFIGAQKVNISALEIIWRKLQTDAQREMSKDYVSTELNNITIDDKNFIFVSTDDPTAEDPVKKLNASGKDVMKRNGLVDPEGSVTGQSTITDIAIGPEGTWSLVDQATSQIYTYDDNGNLLFAFGDAGSQFGNIDKIGAICYQGSKILAIDSNNCSIVVYRRTEYGDLLLKALENENNRKYDQSIDDWTEILKRNNNFESAYIQIGKSLYRQGKYEESMEYYRSAFDTTNYSESYKEIRKEWASKYFWMLPIVIVLVCLAIGKFFGFAGKVNKRTALKVGRKSMKEELLYAFHVIFHPFDGFWDLKHEKRGSVKSAFVILFITIIAYFYNSIGQGYIFNPRVNATFSFLTATGSVLAPVLLWVVANWCLTTLFEGEGSMGDVFTATCYCLVPLPLLLVPSTIASNFLASSEGGILTLLSTLAFIWVGLLVFLGTMVTHDYSILKNILTCVASIVGMAFIMFLGILFSTLMAKFVSLVTNIIEEINYRL